MTGCGDICAFPIWTISDGTFRPKSTPVLPKGFIDKLNSRKEHRLYSHDSPGPFKPTFEPKITSQDISGIPWRPPNPSTPKPFEPKFSPAMRGVTTNAFTARQTMSVGPYTDKDVAQILDMVYNHANHANHATTHATTVHPRHNPPKSTTPRHTTPKRCPHSKTEQRARFVFGYMRELIRYIRTTTAVNYVPADTISPNVSHKMVTFVGTKINKLTSTDPKLLGTRRHSKVRLYKKLYIPLVIAVRHRDELMRLRVAHKGVRADYDDIMKRLDKRATVGVNLSVPTINQDILTYIERYGMPEEFLFDPQLMQGIKNEAVWRS